MGLRPSSMEPMSLSWSPISKYVRIRSVGGQGAEIRPCSTFEKIPSIWAAKKVNSAAKKVSSAAKKVSSAAKKVISRLNFLAAELTFLAAQGL